MSAQWHTLVTPVRTRATTGAKRLPTRSRPAATVCRLRGRARPCRGPAMALPVRRPAWPTGKSSAGRRCGEVYEGGFVRCVGRSVRGWVKLAGHAGDWAAWLKQ